MWILNNILNMVFDGLLFPFRTLHPLVGLTVVSVLGSIGMLMAYKKTSNQDGIEAVKRAYHTFNAWAEPFRTEGESHDA